MAYSEKQPHPLLDPFVPAMSAWSLVSAVSVGVFDAIANDKHTPGGIAEELELDPEAVERLLAVLTCLGYVRLEDEGYWLTDVANQTLTEDAPHRLKNWVRFCRIQLLAMERLENVLTNRGRVNLYDLMESREDLRVHLLAMAETAIPAADWLAANVPVPKNAKLMLDVGGSHAVYSAAICRGNPPMRSDVMELPPIIDVATNVANELGATRFVQFFEGDILISELTSDYDLVFMGNLIHHIPAGRLPGVIDKIHDHIVPGGTIAIWDVAESKGQPVLTSSVFSLFFYMTSGSRCYTDKEIQQLLTHAGFGHFSKVCPQAPSPHVLYTARKPD